MITSKIEPDKDYYEYVVYKHDQNVEILNKALDIVVKFIKDRSLILVGGMAIDFALRLKGDRLYSDNVIPDYDFISTNFIKDSRDLGEILCKAGLENVSIINALHINTIKVRVDFVTVADITYNPSFIFDSIPTLRYKGIKFIHPNYQKIDMHLSISHPLNYPPLENVYFRMKKDMSRFMMLEKEYPINVDMIDESIRSGNKIKSQTSRALIKHLEGNAIGGMTGYYIYKSLYKDNTTKYKYDYLKTKDKFYLYSDKASELVDQIKKDKNIKISKMDKYASILDRVPSRYQLETDQGIIIIYDNCGNQVSANKIKIGDVNTYVVNPQRILLFMLYMYHTKLNIQSKTSRASSLLHIESYIKLRDMVINAPPQLEPLFLPSIESYGAKSVSHSVELMIRPIRDKLKDKEHQQYRPKNIYPKPDKDKTKHCKPLKDASSQFDLNTAEDYFIDGRVIESE